MNSLIHNFNTKVKHMDYNMNEGTTYALLVPLFSFAIQLSQTHHNLPHLENGFFTYDSSNKKRKIRKAHISSSLIQLVIAASVYAFSNFKNTGKLLGIIGALQLTHICVDTFRYGKRCAKK